ncbi:MAG: GFA family protein [Marivibrio sp.]|uniref:GFA family protein n=1 Tax=Marivibrio sp. TaxID=2039719 RepID=UPI0032EE69C5
MDLSDTEVTHATGGCLCGAVRYEIRGSLRPVVACHCEQCRRTSGHFVAASGCAQRDLILREKSGLTWFQSSDAAERGFCNRCGGNLFYRRRDPGDGRVSVMAGTLDPPTGLRIVGHIFAAAKSDYYAIGDETPKFAGDYDSPEISDPEI